MRVDSGLSQLSMAIPTLISVGIAGSQPLQDGAKRVWKDTDHVRCVADKGVAMTHICCSPLDKLPAI